MLKTLPKTAHQQTVCEANYLRLKKILNNFSKGQYSFRTINPDESSYDITFKTIHKTKHTLIVEAKQKSLKNDFNNFILRIQISLDAKLAEVVSYQGKKRFHFLLTFQIPNLRMKNFNKIDFLLNGLKVYLYLASAQKSKYKF